MKEVRETVRIADCGMEKEALRDEFHASEEVGEMKRIIVLVTVMTLVGVGSGVWAADTVKIGVVGPRTGPAAATGSVILTVAIS